MSGLVDFRLLPAALVVWAAAWCVLSDVPLWWMLLLVLLPPTQLLVCGSLGLLSAVFATRAIEREEAEHASWATHRLEQAVAGLPETEAGLIRGMVLGDVAGQSEADRQMFIDTGLSHLSAVSGANVAIVLTTAFLLCKWARIGPLGQVVVGAGALAGFVAVVGTEPSVLRASVTGVVALLAVVNSSKVEPQHALFVGVIGLVLADSHLATNYGFALSVSATLSIVLLSPLFRRLLAPLGWPEVVTSALAVALAADLATMPIIALMVGEVSLVSVMVNVVVSAATAPITVVGLVSVAIPELVWVTYPFAWWIVFVAETAVSFPLVTVSASVPVVLIAYGWVVLGLVWGRPRLTAGIVAALIAVNVSWARPVEFSAPFEVATEADAHRVPPGTDVVVVQDASGSKRERLSVTPAGIPVLYPNRDGPMQVMSNGTQRPVR